MYGDRGQANGSAADATIVAGPLVRVQLSFSRTLWRIGPAWSVLAGALAFGWTPADAGAILRLGAAIALGDLAWGSLRPFLPGLTGKEPSASGQAPTLPYAMPDAPLARLLSGPAASTGLPVDAAWQPLAAGLALTLALSLLIGPGALALSLGALLLTALAWLWLMKRGDCPAFILALLDVASPWLLGMSLLGSPVFVAHGWVAPFALLGAFSLLQWGILRAGQGNIVATAGVWLGQLAVLATLVALKQAWASALVAAALAAPSWWLLRRDRAGLGRALPWWWATLAITAFGLV